MATSTASKAHTKTGKVKRINSYLGKGASKRGSASCPTVTRYVISVAHGRPGDIPLIDVEAQSFPVVALLKPQDEIVVTYDASGAITKIESKLI